MPTFTRDLEATLNEALAIARANGQSAATVAHFALALAADVEAAEVLWACAVDIDSLKLSLRQSIAEMPADGVASDVSPDAAVSRALQHAVMRAKAAGRDTVGGASVLVALLGETDDDVVRLLHDAGITRYDAILYVAHGVRKGRELPLSFAEPPPEASGGDTSVLLLNDDYTPMEFVVGVLGDQFGKSRDAACRTMLEVHHKGWAQCGVFSHEEATAKVAAVRKLARDHQHPLLCVTEPIRGRSDALVFSKPRTVVASGARDRKRA